MEEPAQTTAEEANAKKQQIGLISEACVSIVGKDAPVPPPFASLGDALTRLNAYHVRLQTALLLLRFLPINVAFNRRRPAS
jgi:hypothetical protein